MSRREPPRDGQRRASDYNKGEKEGEAKLRRRPLPLHSISRPQRPFPSLTGAPTCRGVVRAALSLGALLGPHRQATAGLLRHLPATRRRLRVPGGVAAGKSTLSLSLSLSVLTTPPSCPALPLPIRKRLLVQEAGLHPLPLRGSA